MPLKISAASISNKIQEHVSHSVEMGKGGSLSYEAGSLNLNSRPCTNARTEFEPRLSAQEAVLYAVADRRHAASFSHAAAILLRRKTA